MEGKLHIGCLREAMNRSGLKSFSALAEKAGVHRNSIAPYLRGEKSLYSRSALALADALNVSPRELVLDTCADDRWGVIPVIEILHQEFEARNAEIAFFLFGSRASGRSREFSDYDIGVTGGRQAISTDMFLAIKERVSQLVDDLSVKVDLTNFDQAPVWFLSQLQLAFRYLTGKKESYYTLVGRIHGIKETIESNRISA